MYAFGTREPFQTGRASASVSSLVSSLTQSRVLNRRACAHLLDTSAARSRSAVAAGRQPAVGSTDDPTSGRHGRVGSVERASSVGVEPKRAVLVLVALLGRHKTNP